MVLEMVRKFIEEIPVTDLLNILEKHYDKHVMITGIWLADLSHQHNPKFIELGVGSVLTLQLRID
jgi:hypothetical protein